MLEIFPRSPAFCQRSKYNENVIPKATKEYPASSKPALGFRGFSLSGKTMPKSGFGATSTWRTTEGGKADLPKRKSPNSSPNPRGNSSWEKPETRDQSKECVGVRGHSQETPDGTRCHPQKISKILISNDFKELHFPRRRSLSSDTL